MQKLQLSIPEPCHESWQQMTPTDQGRFCNACAKEVVDFSTMTAIQVLNYFTNTVNEKVCGRALPEQLDRAISRPGQPKKRLFWYWNYIVMFLMVFTKGNAAKAQGAVKAVTECSPVKRNDMPGELTMIGKIKADNRQMLSGRVVDEKGKSITSATIKIKGQNTGVSSDAAGFFKINVKPADVLAVSTVGYKTKEVIIGDQKDLKIVLDEYEFALGGLVVVAVNVDGVFNQPFKQTLTALLEVKDNETAAAIANSTISITKKGVAKPDTGFTDNKGNYKIKAIKNYETYLVKVEAKGYETNEFTINGNDFNDAKKVWEVLLKKETIVENKKLADVVITPLDIKRDPKTTMGYMATKVDAPKLNSVKPINVSQGLAGKVSGVQINLVNNTAQSDTRIRLGGVRSVLGNNQALLVVDDVKVPISYISKLNPNDVDSVKVLKGASASALYGSEAGNGVIIVTTKKLKVKNLDTVSVTASVTIKGAMRMGALVTGVAVKRSLFTDTLKMVTTKITGAINIYPNPVQRGNASIISLKLKQTGLYQMQVTDAGGRIVLQKQLNATTKEFLDKIETDTRWGAGVFYISILDNKHQLINKTRFIVL